RHYQNGFVLAQRVDQLHRALAPHRQRQHRVRKQYGIAHRQNGILPPRRLRRNFVWLGNWIVTALLCHGSPECPSLTKIARITLNRCRPRPKRCRPNPPRAVWRRAMSPACSRHKDPRPSHPGVARANSAGQVAAPPTPWELFLPHQAFSATNLRLKKAAKRAPRQPAIENQRVILLEPETHRHLHK